MGKQVMIRMDLNAGTITTQYTIWCGNCLHWDTVSGSKKTAAAEEFRRSGWGKSRGKWLCPDCTLNGVKLKEDKEESESKESFVGSEEARQEMATDETLLFNTEKK